jgi:hypothetical protein
MVDDYVVPRAKKVLRPFIQIITTATQMYVCKMEESHKQFFLKTNLSVKAANSIKTSSVETILYDKQETMAMRQQQARH